MTDGSLAGFLKRRGRRREIDDPPRPAKSLALYSAELRCPAPFGSLTAVITSLVLEPAKEANDPILAKLEKIEAELAKLRSRLEES